MQERRKAREFVVQVSYAHELLDENLDTTFQRLAENTDLSKPLLELADAIVQKSVAHRQKFDKLIVKHSKNWDLDRIAVIDRLILRMAFAEFFYFDDIPPKVSISEAIEIAKVFSTPESSSFINGILDAVFNDGLEEGKLKLL